MTKLGDFLQVLGELLVFGRVVILRHGRAGSPATGIALELDTDRFVIDADDEIFELPLLGQLGNGPNCTVELARGEGARMTIRWEGKEGLDLVGLVEAFWRSGA